MEQGVEGNFHCMIPYRIGMDFDGFRGKGVHDWIPNLSLSDLVQVNYSGLLRKKVTRRALEGGVTPYKFGVELDFRRRLDPDVGKDPESGNGRIEMNYQHAKKI